MSIRDWFVPTSISRTAGVFWLAWCALAVSGCASPEKAPDDDRSYLERAVTKEVDELRVTASALGAGESAEIFGAQLDGAGVQPVWLSVTNRSAALYSLFPTSVDNDYFPPNEVARRSELIPGGLTRDQLKHRLHELAVPNFAPPGKTVSGFVYTHTDEGLKAFNVDLVRSGALVSFHFTTPVPGLLIDNTYANTNPECTDIQTDLTDEEQLKEWIEELPCCTKDKEGHRGDPLNVVYVGSLNSIKTALVARNWDVTAAITGDSVWQMMVAFVFQQRDRYAPVSELYLFDRRHDVAFQKSRDVIEERNHLRLWLAPVCFQHRTVWVGHVSRDIGIKLTGKLSPPTTHVIDPDVDDARYHLVQDMYYSRLVRQLGFVQGVGEASIDHPRYNAGGDPYHTDALRALFLMSDVRVPVSESELLNWLTPDSK